MRSNRKYVRNEHSLWVPVLDEEEEERLASFNRSGWVIEERQGGILYADPRKEYNFWIPPEK